LTFGTIQDSTEGFKKVYKGSREGRERDEGLTNTENYDSNFIQHKIACIAKM